MNLLKYFLLLVSAPAFAAQFNLQSKNFKNDEEIPLRFTCKGESISPELSWSGAPKGTKSFALIVDSPQTDGAPTYWVLYNLPHVASSMGEGTKTFPPGTQQGFNESKERQYGGPCPGADVRFKLYALNNTNHFFAPPVREDLEKAMKGHILGETELTGKVSKPDDQLPQKQDQ